MCRIAGRPEVLLVAKSWLCMHGVVDVPSAKCMYVHGPDISL